MAVAALGQLFVEEPPRVWGSRSVDCFKRLEHIGRGRASPWQPECVGGRTSPLGIGGDDALEADK
ncbi:hypothetical protein Pint_26565 [Pistacia integerrima]|uniref:Uncharacterized protein n=1 Tax=Pistacia integerrima TaxID=434235 RepID=A0ACC0YM27_9ROSI|nr:hypothetical protein Pint_26565 [Pistacia integerrima]